jgi:hypothetical protein
MKKSAFQSAAIAGMVGFISVLLMLLVNMVLTPGAEVQPSLPIHDMAGFFELVEHNPRIVLTYYAADYLFAFSYIVVFVGLFQCVADKAMRIAVVGLIFGIMTGLLDILENSIFVSAVLAEETSTYLDQSRFLIYVVARIKWIGAYAFFYVIILLWTRKHWFDWLLWIVMLLFVLLGIASIALSALTAFSSLFLVVGMLLFAVHFMRQRKQKD